MDKHQAPSACTSPVLGHRYSLLFLWALGIGAEQTPYVRLSNDWEMSPPKVTGFCILLLCWMCLSGLGGSVESSWSFVYRIMPSSDTGPLTSLPCWYSFHFSYLMTLMKMLNIMLSINVNTERGHPFLVPDFKENALGFSCLLAFLQLVQGRL